MVIMSGQHIFDNTDYYVVFPQLIKRYPACIA
jgi:hypothetical protein